MNKTVIDFTKGIKHVSIDKFRSEQQSNVNNGYDMAKITIILKIKENRKLYNALKYGTYKINKCKICGSNDIESGSMDYTGYTDEVHYIYCKSCKSTTPDCKSEEEAIDRWNKINKEQ
jgi:hypothetical protein